jgi:hypothetical protein
MYIQKQFGKSKSGYSDKSRYWGGCSGSSEVGSSIERATITLISQDSA